MALGLKAQVSREGRLGFWGFWRFFGFLKRAKTPCMLGFLGFLLFYCAKRALNKKILSKRNFFPTTIF